MTETELLFTDVLSCDRTALYLDRTRKLDREQAVFISSVLRRRMQGEPFAYIMGEIEFMGFEFFVDRRVLVPRQDTEILVEKALEFVTASPRHRVTGLSILEIGTGSGCIAVSLAKFLPQARITATDISHDALAVARANACRHAAGARVELVCCDLFPDDAQGSFDLVVSNPPYVRSRDIAALEPEVQYEPRLALDGGSDGLAVFRRLIPQAALHLKQGGLLILEIGYDQRDAVTSLIEKSEFFKVEEVVKDYNGIDRVAAARKKGR